MACVVYSTIPSFWLMIHPFAELWRRRRDSPYRVLVPLWMAMWFLVGAITWRWRHIELYGTWWTWVAACGLFGIGIWLYVQSGKKFSGAQLGGLPEVRRTAQAPRLVTSGIRARVRHPVYLAHLCEMLAWSIGSGLAVCFALTMFAIVTGAVMMRMEDAELELRFGDDYREYRRRVPAITPRLRWSARGRKSDSPRVL